MEEDELDHSRRRFLSSILKAGLSFSSGWAREKAATMNGVSSKAVRRVAASPPGSRSHDNLNSRCNSCQLCIEKCPGKVLHPAVSEYGSEGVMHPFMDFSKGFCLYDCTACGDVCPTHALETLQLDEKQSIQIGIAVVVKELCLSYDTSHECRICRSECEANAIKMKPDYTNPQKDDRGMTVFPTYPQVDNALCIGCGKCEFKCPVSPFSAIHVEGYVIHK